MSLEWRDHPALLGKFHPDRPDDIEIVVHDGGPRLTTTRPERVWAKVTEMESYPFGEVFTATVLSTPVQVVSARANQSVKVMASAEFHWPIMVTDKYLNDRPHWIISTCPSCGLPELFDAPSDLMRRIFVLNNVPAGATLEAFSSFCPSCFGSTVIKHRDNEDEPYRFKFDKEDEPRAPFTIPPPPQRKWWQFWKQTTPFDDMVIAAWESENLRTARSQGAQRDE